MILSLCTNVDAQGRDGPFSRRSGVKHYLFYYFFFLVETSTFRLFFFIPIDIYIFKEYYFVLKTNEKTKKNL